MLRLGRFVLWGGGSTSTAGSLLVLGCKLQVRDGLHQLGLGLLQEAVNILSAVLGQGCPFLLPVSLSCLQHKAGLTVMLFTLEEDSKALGF